MKASRHAAAMVISFAMLPSLAQAKDPAMPANTTSGVQVALGKCVSQSVAPRADLISAVLTAFVSKGVNLLGVALTAAGQDKIWKATGSRNLDLPATGPLPDCIQIVRGRFRTNGAEAAKPGWADAMEWQGGGWADLNANGLWLADKPDFFFEGYLVQSTDKSAVSIRPLYAVMNQPLGGRAFRDKERAVALFLAFAQAGTRPDLNANPSATITLGTMNPGQILRYPSAIPSPARSTPYDSAWFLLSDADAHKPMTVTSLLAETQSGSPFFAFIASIFNDEMVKKEITDRANILVVPSAGQDAQAAQQQAQQSAIATAEAKLGAALAALVDCKRATTDIVTKAIVAKAALRDYLTADLALPAPTKKVTNEKIGSINLFKPSGLADQCGAIYSGITGEAVP